MRLSRSQNLRGNGIGNNGLPLEWEWLFLFSVFKESLVLRTVP
jgi:hypothetical protein